MTTDANEPARCVHCGDLLTVAGEVPGYLTVYEAEDGTTDCSHLNPDDEEPFPHEPTPAWYRSHGTPGDVVRSDLWDPPEDGSATASFVSLALVLSFLLPLGAFLLRSLLLLGAVSS